MSATFIQRLYNDCATFAQRLYNDCSCVLLFCLDLLALFTGGADVAGTAGLSEVCALVCRSPSAQDSSVSFLLFSVLPSFCLCACQLLSHGLLLQWSAEF